MMHMLAQTFLTVWAVVYRPKTVCGVRDCIESQRPCAIDPSCASLLEAIPKLCGPTDNQHCFSTRQPECRETLMRLKSAPELQSSCYCQNPSSRSCQDYYNLLYNHPCLQQQRLHPALYLPSSQAFNFDLEFANQLLLSKHVLLSCTSALHACRKSPLCRRVYDEYRRRCKIKDNRCRMTNAALCYNSFELIKLTPLWKCICDRPSEKRCYRIQKSIIGNACIVGSFPWLPEKEAEELDAYNHSLSTAPSVIRRTTPIRVYPPRTTVAPAARPRPTSYTLRTLRTTTATTSISTHADETHEEEVDVEVPPEVPPEEEDSNLSPESQEGVTEAYPGDEEYVLIPHIAVVLILPIMHKIREILIEQQLMVTIPTTTTTAASTTEEPGPESIVSDGDYEEVTESILTETTTTVTTTSRPVTALRPLTPATGGRRRTTAAAKATTTPSSSTSARSSSPQTTGRSRERTSVTTKRVPNGLPSPTRMLVMTTSTEAVEVTMGVEDLTEAETEYPDYSSPEPSTTAAILDDTTVFIDDTIPNPEIMPSGLCWKQLREWRELPEFEVALMQFHNSCRWTSPLNDSCDAINCLDSEARMKRWMGEIYDFCRNLTCPEDDQPCAELLTFLSPGCVNAANFLEDMDNDVITCRDLKRNMVLSVPRGHHKRIFPTEDCSQMCTCDWDGKIKCEPLPCTITKDCQGSYATFPHGAPAFKAFQGQCLCYMTKLLCVRPYNYTISKGVWLFMGYSQLEEEMLYPKTNMTVANNVVDRLKRLPYPNRRTEPCLFHVEPSEAEFVILKSDEFEFDNSTYLTGTEGTRLNEEYCEKFFRWIVDDVSVPDFERHRKVSDKDLLLSLMKLAEIELDRRIANSAPVDKLTAFSSCLCVVVSFLTVVCQFSWTRFVL